MAQQHSPLPVLVLEGAGDAALPRGAHCGCNAHVPPAARGCCTTPPRQPCPARGATRTRHTAHPRPRRRAALQGKLARTLAREQCRACRALAARPRAQLRCRAPGARARAPAHALPPPHAPRLSSPPRLRRPAAVRTGTACTPCKGGRRAGRAARKGGAGGRADGRAGGPSSHAQAHTVERRRRAGALTMHRPQPNSPLLSKRSKLCCFYGVVTNCMPVG